MATRNEELAALAQRVADALPGDVVDEIVLTGSVSRGVADDASDIEMLLVTREPLSLDQSFALAAKAGLTGLDTWGPADNKIGHVFGLFEGAPVELIWWDRSFADSHIDEVLAGKPSAAAEALANGVALRTTGLLAGWQAALAEYPEEVARQHIEDAAMPWGGFHAEGLLTLIRPGDRLALMQWIVEGADAVLTIVYAINGEWQPSAKRLARGIEQLEHKPDRLAERIESSLTDPDPRKALLAMTELQLEAVQLAPSGPNVDRARKWLAEGVEILRGQPMEA